MLVLSRKKNQSIIVNNNIEVVIIDLGPEQVKLGFRAPKDVSIHRSEVYDKIKEEMQRAAKSHPKLITSTTSTSPKKQHFSDNTHQKNTHSTRSTPTDSKTNS
ncbi:carbon storage regulator [Spirochaetota bacterium]|nr:carbon storage regulator [Spirochaetota bacterium]